MQTMEIGATEISVINNAVFPVEKIVWSQQLQVIQNIILCLTAVHLEEVRGLQRSFSFLSDRKFYI